MNAPLRRRAPGAEPSPGSALADFVSAHRAGLGALVVVAAAAVAGWIAWQRHADDVRSHPDLVLFPERIEVRGAGPWIRGDIRAEALRDASLDGGLPLDDPGLTERLRRAFARHPWVREVVGVTLREPAAAMVEIRCREPVAMVRVKDGLYAVDAEGVVLPSDDFTAESAAAYPTIAHVGTTPIGAAGTRWGDALVVEGASVAAAVGPEWPRLGLRDLLPVGTAQGVDWRLVGDDGRTIRFGCAPGRERPGEPTAATKLARLQDLPVGAEWAGNADLTVAPAAAPVSAGDPPPAPAPP
jgi:hypothetical protein